MLVLEIYPNGCCEAINWRLIGNMIFVCWSLICWILEWRKFVKSYSLFIVVWSVRNKGNVIMVYFCKTRTFLLFVMVDIPVLSLYLLSWLPVLSECPSPLLLSLLSVLLWWLLPVAASLWWRQSLGIVYLRLAALPSEYINRGRCWSISDWTGIAFARPLSCTNSPPAPWKSALHAATSQQSNKINL